MILFLHHRYRTTGGEERVVEDLAWLVREELGEDVEILQRDSSATSGTRAAAGLLRGGLDPDDVTAAVKRTGARVVHAHNLNPTFGWRALAAARAAGARTVLHLHNYRLVCAVATCFNSRGEDCTRCQGRNTLPGVRLNCRGSAAEAAAYAASLALHQRRIVAHADAVIVPSHAAAARLRELRAPIGEPHVLGHGVREYAERSRAADGTYAFVASRLAVEKGVDVAIAAARAAGVALVVAGDGPEAARLRATAPEVRFTGRVDRAELQRLRAGAAVELVPTRAAETFGLSAVEAMAAGLPVAASAMGALNDLAPEAELVPAGDAAALAQALQTAWGDAARGERGLQRARELASPTHVAQRLRSVYG
ncbi:MAG TPA: glycosyltransferase family 4 protein [Solirubrobacteraceae bacterium]